MEAINEMLVNPEFQAAAVIILGIVFKAMWNAIRDQSRAIELSGGPAKTTVKELRAWYKPLSRIAIDLTRGWIEVKETDKPAMKILKDTLLNLIGRK
jgi:hypothetical protein